MKNYQIHQNKIPWIYVLHDKIASSSFFETQKISYPSKSFLLSLVTSKPSSTNFLPFISISKDMCHIRTHDYIKHLLKIHSVNRQKLFLTISFKSSITNSVLGMALSNSKINCFSSYVSFHCFFRTSIIISKTLSLAVSVKRTRVALSFSLIKS